jgi:hypothetical protein
MITMGSKTEPNYIVEKEKWFSKMDESFRLLCLSISPNIQFHIKTETILTNLGPHWKDVLGSRMYLEVTNWRMSSFLRS